MIADPARTEYAHWVEKAELDVVQFVNAASPENLVKRHLCIQGRHRRAAMHITIDGLLGKRACGLLICSSDKEAVAL